MPLQRSWFQRQRALMFSGGGLIALAAAAALAVALVLRPGASVGKLVPAGADLYVSIALDPSMTQKMNLLGVAHKFPDYRSDTDIKNKIAEQFKDSGLSFSSDVQPWLGPQLGFMAEFKGDPHIAVVVLSRDDAKAKAALTKFRNGTQGRKQTWTDETYAGISIAVGKTPPGGSKEPLAYAYVDHAVVIADKDSVIKEIIDADQGKQPRLVDTANYKATVSQLPTDRLALLYVNGPSVVSRLKQEIKKQGSSSTQLPQATLDQLDAFIGLGFTLAAQSNGIAGDLLIKVDPSKLSAQMRESLNAPSHKNPVLDWIPQHAYGALTATGINRGLQQAIDQASGPDSQVSGVLSLMGLTGPDGAVAHLTGDVGLEFGGDTHLLTGAVFLGTDNEASMRKLFSTLADFADLGSPGSSGITMRQQSYDGVPITIIDQPELSSYGVTPAFAVTGGLGILSSSPEELKSILDAHKQARTITSAANFMSASRQAYRDYDSLFYVDFGELSTALQNFLPAYDRIQLNTQVGSKAAPIKALIVTAQTTSDRISERIFLLIDDVAKA